LGQGRFVGVDAVDVEGRRLEFARAVIATGARAAQLRVPGAERVECLTNEDVFWLTELPPRLVVVGAGPIGCELGQAFGRFGAEVTIVAQDLLPREDDDTRAVIEASLRRDGVRVALGAAIDEISARDSEIVVRHTVDGRTVETVADRLLLGAGRAANVEDLGLEAAEVAHGPEGITVDDSLRTSNPRVFAAGDVCSRFKFTHAADAMARIVVQNALFFGRKKASALHIPWCTYTDPEVAHAGLTVADAAARGVETATFTVEFKDVDRAILDGATDGFARAIVRAGTDQLLGVTVVAEHAGEMIGEAVLALNHGIRLGQFANTIHPYPTQAEALRKLGDAYNRTRLTPRVKRLFERVLAWRR
jgi:pyruvate/2-oxoglutarate dehydrogenase complex dihydrolipoamide dehydrogenase (E3) component